MPASAPCPPTAACPPTFVLGAPRSGTSLVYKALCLHPDAAWISNYVRSVPTRRELALLNRVAHHAPGRRNRAWFGADGRNAYVYGAPRSAADRYFPMPVEGEPVLRWCGFPELPGGTVRPDAALRLRQVVRQVVRWGGGSQFINKRIANNQRVPQLLEAFPNARFVVVTRDGRAVAASLAKVDWWPTTRLFWCPQTPQAWVQAGGDGWELCAQEWVHQLRSIEDGLMAVPDDQITRVRFEHFIESPRAALMALADVIGLRQSQRWESDLERLSFPARGHLWASELEPQAIQTIERVQLPLLQTHGYA